MGAPVVAEFVRPSLCAKQPHQGTDARTGASHALTEWASLGLCGCHKQLHRIHCTSAMPLFQSL